MADEVDVTPNLGVSSPKAGPFPSEPAERDFVMVGNDPDTGHGTSPDRTAALSAGFRFILERDLAAGHR